MVLCSWFFKAFLDRFWCFKLFRRFLNVCMNFVLFTFRLSTEWYFPPVFLSVFRVVSCFRLFFRRFLRAFVVF